MKGGGNYSLGHVTDILPTLLQVSGTPYPVAFHEHQLTTLDGQSFLPLLQGKAYEGRDHIFFEHAKGKAYIKGPWKLFMKTFGNDWNCMI